MFIAHLDLGTIESACLALHPANHPPTSPLPPHLLVVWHRPEVGHVNKSSWHGPAGAVVVLVCALAASPDAAKKQHTPAHSCALAVHKESGAAHAFLTSRLLLQTGSS